MAYDSLMVFTGNANPKLAADVVKRLNISLGRANVGRFSDGEVSCEILEHVRGHDVFVLQSTCNPTNDNLMELMVMVDALKRASAGRITAAIPISAMPARTAVPARRASRSPPRWWPTCCRPWACSAC
jgi:ribose-phosphate pyrophosphokinase